MREEKTVDKSMLVARKVVEDLLPNKAAVNVGVDLRRGEIRMAQHHLNGSEVSAAFEQMGGKGVAKRVRTNVFRDAGFGSVDF